MSEKGKLIVVSGPSGAGKSTVVFKMMAGRDDCCFSTSVTTRKPRPGEIDGRDYFFIDRDRFQEMINRDELLEHAVYVDNCYGTPRKYVEERMAAGMNVILDIEVQGARQVAEKVPGSVKIFVVPPSLEELERRLRNRGTETEASITGRLERARQEYREAGIYDFIIVNDDAEVAARELAAIILAEHCRAADRSQYLNVN